MIGKLPLKSGFHKATGGVHPDESPAAAKQT